MAIEYLGLSEINGPLVVLEGVKNASYEEIVEFHMDDGTQKIGRIVEIYEDKAVIQVFEGTDNMSLSNTHTRLTGHPMEIGLSEEILGRTFNGIGQPIDGLGEITPEVSLNINGLPLNPVKREYPRNYINTGISAIDGLTTLIRGQKLPIFSGNGLPHDKLAAQIVQQASLGDDSDETYGENAVTTSVETVEKMCLEKEHASEYNVEISEDEQKALEEAAKNFIAANSDETIAELAVDEDMVKTFLELETYDVKMKDAIEAKADVKLDEKEYQQMSFSYASAKVSGDDLSDDDIKTNKENLQKFFDKVKEDPTADFNTLGDEISKDMTATTGTCPTYEEGDDSAANGTTYPDEVRTALRKLDEGALNEEIIKTDSVWYVVRLDSKNDETATESKKESLTNTKKDDFYNDTTDGWKKKADIKEETKLIKKIKITDNHSFTIQTPTPTPDSDVTETPAAEDSTAADSTEVEATATPEAEK